MRFSSVTPHFICALVAVSVVSSCRPVRPPASPADRASEPEPVETARSTPPPEMDEGTGEPVSPAVAAIIDSIETAVRDSIEREAEVQIAEAARQDSISAAARRDSIEAAAAASIAAAALRDSIDAVARRDSIEAAARDSIAAVALRDSITAVALQDSIEAAIQDSLQAAAQRDSISAAQADSAAATVLTDDLEQLRALGPAYIPYDRGPRLVWDTEAQASLATTLLPVIRSEELEARTTTYFWLLIRADGIVDEVILQTSSGNGAFDAAAERAAQALIYAPAIRGERAVPTWIVRDISLLMQ